MKALAPILAGIALASAATATAATQQSDLVRSILGKAAVTLPPRPSPTIPVVNIDEPLRGALEKIAKALERVCSKTPAGVKSSICSPGPASP